MASEYHRGEMEIQEQTSTYHLFVMMAKWGSLALAALLIFITLWFCTDTGFIGSFITGLVVSVGGFLVMREHETPEH
ncbi:aa3-type cytochrome c oxidase subunit IV [Phenylobacterium sp. LH3H17]|uniref:aa3-type cytochrome c oxidase subunit IV n=1 Tax=Phenylobacterium sp. LH3H17 TaxID=2903901 RepID=UPI0020C97E5E|nr:aa3-type cytochrome c oxidase subunit IV [Phenylobacterium sp. LH3H17]UTP40164.1 aa3-type cytochrome c oxidase subunit IV [Phenylobacterium sp. LH3H17]